MARLIERGSTPAWRYSRVADVPQREVDAFFAALDFCEELTPALDEVDALLAAAGREPTSRL